jgi:hypothetical protein
MRADACSRLFEAEAMRDGRLGGAELAAYTRHASGCPACARELRSLEALGGKLRALPAREADDLGVLRERTRLMAAFDATLVTGRRRWRAGFVAAAAVVLFAIAAAGLWRPRSVTSPAAAIAVRAGNGTTWSRRIVGQQEIVSLGGGTLSIRVDHAAGARRLLVQLPDGELEDIGTVFTVSVVGAHTTGVAVEEGSVVLRLRGRPPVTIVARETWHADEPPVSAAELAPPAPIPPPSSPRPVLRHPVRTQPATSTTTEPDPSQEFRVAVSALHGGDACAAGEALARFVDQHPEDARVEDAAYLEVIARQRCGDDSQLKRAVDQYLRRYPQGFRHAEVERLSR